MEKGDTLRKREREKWGKWENKQSHILHHITLSCTQGIN